MANNFKNLAAATRAAIPQIDPESAKSQPAPVAAEQTPQMQATVPYSYTPAPQPVQADAPVQQIQLTQVNTRETPTNRGFSMYPSRHRQIARDIAYVEDRKPWEIIEDALEEYVVKHYGKAYKRQ